MESFVALSENGRLYAIGATEPYRFGGVWARQRTTGPERLVVGPSGHLLQLLLRMAERLPEPLFLLVVLGVPRVGPEGRYESEALTHAQLSGLVRRYSDFLETDPRTEVWVGATNGEGLLVLDQHGVIYAYGDLMQLEDALRGEGLVPGELPEIPDPHEHRYESCNDEHERALTEDTAWRRVLPLEEGDFAN